MKKLTHTDAKGKASMVDVSSKPIQVRTAIAEGHITLQKATLKLIRVDQVMKGDVLTVAEIAGIQGGKRTSELIPLCHPLAISKIQVKSVPDKTGVKVMAMAKCTGQTGIEMEALTAVSVALLTIYDIEEIRLLEKSKKDIEH
jgi:cyclic pyranopterin phosphate synthase